LPTKATHEGKVAAEVIAGEKRAFDARVIPSVAYTDPEVRLGWRDGDRNAKAKGIAVREGHVFPLGCERSLARAKGRDEGFTQAVVRSADAPRCIGGGIVGPNAGELIGEVALSRWSWCTMLPTWARPSTRIRPVSESVALAAEAFEGTLHRDLYAPKARIDALGAATSVRPVSAVPRE
jgi:dihydrolipoamide dehydrogenase